MTTVTTFSVFLPAEALALLIVLGAIAFIVGARRLAMTLVGLAIAGAVLPPLIEPLLDEVPGWVLALLLVHVGFALLRAVLVVFIGGRASDHAICHFVGALLVGLFLLPFSALRGGIFATAWLIRRML